MLGVYDFVIASRLIGEWTQISPESFRGFSSALAETQAALNSDSDNKIRHFFMD
jgi:hypothetical protein